jgi:hypothetical protein
MPGKVAFLFATPTAQTTPAKRASQFFITMSFVLLRVVLLLIRFVRHALF